MTALNAAKLVLYLGANLQAAAESGKCAMIPNFPHVLNFTPRE